MLSFRTSALQGGEHVSTVLIAWLAFSAGFGAGLITTTLFIVGNPQQ